MEDRIRYKGRFIKKKVLDKKIKIKKSLEAKKDAKNNLESVTPNLLEGPRLIELKELCKNLKCCQCYTVLSLDDTVDETRSGLDCILRVKCKKCFAITRVPTGKFHSVHNNNKSKHSDTTTGAILGKFK